MQVTYGKGFEVSHPTQVVSMEQMMALQEVMLEMPQAPGMETTHHFAGGMYCRKIVIPKDTIVVSKVHKTEHLFIGCVGELQVAGQGETYIIRPGDIVPSPVGTKRVVHALTDVVVLTVHKTDKLVADLHQNFARFPCLGTREFS